MYFEKIASESQLLAEEIVKVASEEIDGMNPQDVYEEMMTDLKEAGYDVSGVTPENVDWQKVFDYGVEKTAEFISEDIAKVASGASINYETAAAAKAVSPFLENDGVANFGSAFGAGNGPIGSVVHAGIDKNVFGGWGTLIGRPAYAENAANASGKINSLLSATNMKLASEDPKERLEAFTEVITKTAADEGQSLDDYIFDLGIEALINERKTESIPQGKVAEWLQPELSFYESRKKEEEITKRASEEVYSAIEEYAKENSVEPVDVVLEYGIQKAAEYIEEFLKDAASGGSLADIEKNISNQSKRDKVTGSIHGRVGGNLQSSSKADVNKALGMMDKGTKGSVKFYGDKAKGGISNIGEWIKKHPGASAGIGGGALLAGGGAYALSKALKKKEEKKEASAEPTATSVEEPTSQTAAILKLAQEKLGLLNQNK